MPYAINHSALDSYKYLYLPRLANWYMDATSLDVIYSLYVYSLISLLVHLRTIQHIRANLEDKNSKQKNAH